MAKITSHIDHIQMLIEETLGLSADILIAMTAQRIVRINRIGHQGRLSSNENVEVAAVVDADGTRRHYKDFTKYAVMAIDFEPFAVWVMGRPAVPTKDSYDSSSLPRKGDGQFNVGWSTELQRYIELR